VIALDSQAELYDHVKDIKLPRRRLAASDNW
jgi:hypothetical protein